MVPGPLSLVLGPSLVPGRAWSSVPGADQGPRTEDGPRTKDGPGTKNQGLRTASSASSASSGYTLIELLVVATIILILASAIMPLARVTMQRQREIELHRTLREMRNAIDKYKDAVDLGMIGGLDVKAGSEGYPPDLETLVEGVPVMNDASGRKLKFLRRIPIDPMTHDTEWGLRSYQDKPESTSWGRQNVFDVYTKSGGTALDGSKYKDW
jgi:general secretion pathway protein G